MRCLGVWGEEGSAWRWERPGRMLEEGLRSKYPAAVVILVRERCSTCHASLRRHSPSFKVYCSHEHQVPNMVVETRQIVAKCQEMRD